jgi:hypothetical protein
MRVAQGKFHTGRNPRHETDFNLNLYPKSNLSPDWKLTLGTRSMAQMIERLLPSKHKALTQATKTKKMEIPQVNTPGRKEGWGPCSKSFLEA